MYYQSESFLTTPIGNNAIDFEKRKKYGSAGPDNVGYGVLRIPPLITGTLDDIRLFSPLRKRAGGICYEYISDSGKLVAASGLQNLVEISNSQSEIHHSTIYVIDNHNHAFYCRYKSYLEGDLPRGSHLIHIDQHSDLNELSLRAPKEVLLGEGTKQSNHINNTATLNEVATYTNEVLDIASFIKPAKACGLISDYEMILTEYSLLQFSLSAFQPFSLIVDIDLDFRAPEMSISHYEQTIRQVKKLIALPQTKCITIATSPTYIDQSRALEILRDVLE